MERFQTHVIIFMGEEKFVFDALPIAFYDTKRSDFGQPPVVANYFYHEEVKKSAKAKS